MKVFLKTLVRCVFSIALFIVVGSCGSIGDPSDSKRVMAQYKINGGMLEFNTYSAAWADFPSYVVFFHEGTVDTITKSSNIVEVLKRSEDTFCLGFVGAPRLYQYPATINHLPGINIVVDTNAKPRY